MHRLRDGTVIKRFPSISEITDLMMRHSLMEIVVDLQNLRAAYDNLLKLGEIRPCGCGKQDCPVHMLSPRACHEMDRFRNDILHKFRRIYPKFNVSMW